MSLPIIIMLSFCSVLAILFTLSKVVSIRTIIRYGAAIDVITTVMFFVIFNGTLGGTLVAVLAGLMMAIFLSGAKSYWNWAYERGYIQTPLKNPTAEEKSAQIVNDLEEAKPTVFNPQDAKDMLNSGIHKNVISIASFFSKKAA